MRRDGTPVRRSRPAPRFDRTPPLWFRSTLVLTFLFTQPILLGMRGIGPRWLIGVGLMLVLLFGVAVVSWERRHRLP
jgi:hypothetical protein